MVIGYYVDIMLYHQYYCWQSLYLVYQLRYFLKRSIFHKTLESSLRVRCLNQGVSWPLISHRTERASLRRVS